MIDFGISQLKALKLINLLTPREAEVVELITLGERSATICKKLRIKQKTLDVHHWHIARKWQMPRHSYPRVWFCAQQTEAEK